MTLAVRYGVARVEAEHVTTIAPPTDDRKHACNHNISRNAFDDHLPRDTGALVQGAAVNAGAGVDADAVLCQISNVILRV